MKRVSVVVVGLTALLLTQAPAQQSTSLITSEVSRQPPPLTLRTRIPLPGVYGRMDHYGWDSKRGILLLAALGNNTVEIVDSWRRVHSITELEHPQAAVYVPGLDRIVVSSQSGKLRVYNAETYALLNTLDFGANADTDNMRYDPASKRVYVAYGRGARGAIAIVDPASMERMREFELGSHPESFQLEKAGLRIFVNLPDQEAIGVIDQKTGAVTKWKFRATPIPTPWPWTKSIIACSRLHCSPDGL
jgi:DNA-binding beta-propeller fold protein YncE